MISNMLGMVLASPQRSALRARASKDSKRVMSMAMSLKFLLFYHCFKSRFYVTCNVAFSVKRLELRLNATKCHQY